RARLVLMPRDVRTVSTSGFLSSVSSSSIKASSSLSTLSGFIPLILLRLADVRDRPNGLHDPFAIVWLQRLEANPHAGIQVFSERAHGVDPLHDAVEHEGVFRARRREAQDEMRADRQRLVGAHEDAHLRDVRDVRVEKGVCGLAGDLPGYVEAAR